MVIREIGLFLVHSKFKRQLGTLILILSNAKVTASVFNWLFNGESLKKVYKTFEPFPIVIIDQKEKGISHENNANNE